jgi:hypothetical protein
MTLHYRLRLDGGTEVPSTFGGNPATPALGRARRRAACRRLSFEVEVLAVAR